MPDLVAPFLVVVLLLNLFVLGTSRVRAVINASAAQGMILGSLLPVVHADFGLRTLLLAAFAVATKGIFIPWMLARAMREADIRRQIEPFVGYVPSLLLGAAGTAASLLYANTLPLAPQHAGSLIVPSSMATVLTGFLILVSRRKAITQVVGYLILENGVFIMGLALIEALPFMVEIGVLLDLFVAVFVLGIMIHHINREFASIDTKQLSTLKE
jgi:hydrogenase-4 component E